MLKISVLVSGGGTNLQALIDAQNNGILKSGKIVQVISSRSDAYALERAKKFGISADVAEVGENFSFKYALGLNNIYLTFNLQKWRAFSGKRFDYRAYAKNYSAEIYRLYKVSWNYGEN